MSGQFSLTVDLKDGFFDDTVILFVDGKEVFHRSRVTTRTMVGFADSTILQLEVGQHTVGILLQEKQVSMDVIVNIQGPLYLGISYEPDKGLIHQLQGEPFKYI